MKEQSKQPSLAAKQAYINSLEYRIPEQEREIERLADEKEKFENHCIQNTKGLTALRKILWLAHGHSGLYGDDGEMQCGECNTLWDYKNMPLSALLSNVLARHQKGRIELTDLKAKLEAAENVIASIASLVSWAQRWNLPFSITVTEANQQTKGRDKG